jgi:hypothetical protein
MNLEPESTAFNQPRPVGSEPPPPWSAQPVRSSTSSELRRGPIPTFARGLSRYAEAGRTVAGRPFLALAWILVLPVGVLATLVFGEIFVAMGWLESRRRFAADGFFGLGAVLAPRRGREQYADGVFRGLWRSHTLPIAVSAIALPTSILVLIPAAIAYGLFAPLSRLVSGAAGLAAAALLPAMLAFVGSVFILAQLLLLVRILAESGPRYALGTVFRASAAAWRTAIEDAPVVLGMAAGLLGSAVAAGALIGASAYLGELLELEAGLVLILTWTGAIAGAAVLSVAAEALAAWAGEARIEPLESQPADFSLSAWMLTCLRGAFGWLAARGLVSVGIFACVIAGVATALMSVATGQTFNSWTGLGWFAVTALALVALHRDRGRA